jgi:hypothetical protein
MRKKKSFSVILVVLVLLSIPALFCGQSTSSATSTSQPVKKRPGHLSTNAKKEHREGSAVARLTELEDAIEQERIATEQLQKQLLTTQQQLQQTQLELSRIQAGTLAESAKVSATETKQTLQATKIQAGLNAATETLTATTATVELQARKLDTLDHPDSISYRGIRIRPGGFIEMTGYFRSHATLSDQATTFNSIPLAAQTNTKLSEFGETARDSRISLRADSSPGNTELTGYVEVDFFGTGPSSNPNQSTSYSPRIRLAWARAKFSDGWTITGGQLWNLTTLNRVGTTADPSTVWIPNVIEAQYAIGYNWGRYAEIRVSKTIGDKGNYAFALTNPSYLNSGATTANTAVSGLASTGAGVDGNSLVSTCTSSASGATPPVVTTTCTNTPTYSTNLAPDVLSKLTYDDPRLGHYELKVLGRIFRDRAAPTVAGSGSSAVVVPGFNNHAYGGGVGYGAVVPLFTRKLNFMAQGLYGRGISRYMDSGQYDFVVESTGEHMKTVLGLSNLAGFEAHPTPRFELWALFGDEYYGRTTYIAGNTVAGYGSAGAVNSGCAFETSALAAAAGVSGTCTGNNRNLWNAKLMSYYDTYKGTFGTLRFGLEVDYIERNTWSGANGLAPKGNDKTAFTTMRWILP